MTEIRKATLVDICSKQTYSLVSSDLVVIVSDAACVKYNGQLLIPPAVTGESYAVKITGGCSSIELILGSCSVNGRSLIPQTPTLLSRGAFITLGSSRTLQLLYAAEAGHQPPKRRILPLTPGKALDISPPSKPQRQKKQEHCEPTLEKLQHLHGNGNALGDGIRPRLQRIAAEVSARMIGYEGRKPPPPYEQVGNSIAYQLLHQQQHRMVTPEIIDALYPALKEIELKDSTLIHSYTSFLQLFKKALESSASVQCMLPADLPTCDLIVDLLLHLCCMPHMTALAEKQGELWAKLLALFSLSGQNQCHMASKRHPSKVLSCMHLNIMSSKFRFQESGWIVLGNTVGTPTPVGGKPVLSEPSLTLALSLTDRQLTANSSDIALVVAIVDFLASVATTAKMSVSKKNLDAQAYTEEQAARILALFQEKLVLRQVMKVPPHLRSSNCFERAYSHLVKALVPVRSQTNVASRTALSGADDSKTITKSPNDNIRSSQSSFNSSFCSDASVQSYLSDAAHLKTDDSNASDDSDLKIGDSNAAQLEDSDLKISNAAQLQSDDWDLKSDDSNAAQVQSDDSDLKIDPTDNIGSGISAGDTVDTVATEEPVHSCNATSPPDCSLSPPLTPNTANLAADVQELLDTLNTPVFSPSSATVTIPPLSRYNRYYRHSQKRRASLKVAVVNTDVTAAVCAADRRDHHGFTEPSD